MRSWDIAVERYSPVYIKSVTQKQWFLGSADKGTLIQLSPIEGGPGDASLPFYIAGAHVLVAQGKGAKA